MSNTTQYGWVCPKCGKVHAPFIPHCSCSSQTNTEKESTDFRDMPRESQLEYFGKK